MIWLGASVTFLVAILVLLGIFLIFDVVRFVVSLVTGG